MQAQAGLMTVDRSKRIIGIKNQDTAGELQRCADNLHEQHQCNRCCDIIFRVIGGLGNVLVIVAFAFLFYKEYFKESDYVAIGGAAISLLANIGKLVADRKRRYDNRRCIKNNVLPVVPVRRVVLDEITLMSLHPEDSALSCLTMYCRCVCCRPLCCMCCCQEPCLRDDPLEPLCTTNPCRCLCCQCTCPCGGARCQYLCSFFTFLPTFEFFESTYNIVSSGWVLSSNVKAISGRIPTNASSKYFQDLTVANQVLESIDVSLAIISLLLSLVIIIWTCRKCCQGTDERPVVQIRHLSDNIRQ
ncbi:uncharacterized protein [Haliotis cracherodii]|uniref:uncharacterized protein n=1 Tax=Haliotis cracherodii TaxID=6455 RepID=UPI0039EC6679